MTASPAAAPRTGAKPRTRLTWRAREAHEHQAERAATRFAAGGQGLSQGLTSTPASSIFMPGSLGFPLPGPLRRDLETAFDGNLGPIRVHTDAIAQAAALRAGAHAFASGRDLYFARGQWSPFTIQGRMLIAHEVAHVLQQTGRAASGGTLRVEPNVAGEAGVQRDPDPNQAVRDARDQLVGGFDIEARFAEHGLLHPATGVDACLAVLDRHAALPLDQGFMDIVARLRAAVTGRSKDEATAAVVGELNARTDAELTDDMRALFRDCLKSLGAADEAVAATPGKTPARTAFGTYDFYVSQRRGDASWVVPFLSTHPVAKKYYPNTVVAVARIDFYGLARGGLDLDPNMKFDETMKGAIEEALLYQPLMPEEREAVALRALAAFDTVRRLPFTYLRQAFRDSKTLLDRFEIKMRFIALYKDENFLPGRVTRAEPELMVILTDAGKRIAPIARRAEVFWNRAKAATLASDRPDMTGKTLTTNADVAARARSDAVQAAIRKRLPTLKGLGKVEANLISALGKAAQLENGAMPSPAALAANFKAAADAIEQITYRIDGELARREKKLVANKLPELDPDSVDTGAAEAALTDDMVYGVVILSLFRLHTYLLQDYAKPAQAADSDERFHQRDEAAKARQTALIRFADIAMLLGYQGLHAAAVDAYHATQKGVRTSFIGLLAPFAPDPVPLSSLAKEFPLGRLKKLPIKGASFVKMAYAIYYGKLIVALEDVLATKVGSETRETTYTAGQEPIINTALKRVETSFQPPKRYRVPRDKTVLFIRPGVDRENVADFLFFDRGKKTEHLHPVLQAFSDQVASGDIWIVPEEYDKHREGLVAWVVQDLDRLSDTLAAVDGVTTLPVGKDKKPLGYPVDYPTSFAWLEALGQAVAANQAMRDSLDAAVGELMEGELAALDGPLRRATTNERRIVGPLIAEQWERVPKSFLKDPDAFYDAPRRAMELTLTFLGNIQPARESERMLQMAALLLELAPVLSRKLASSTHFGDQVRLSGTERFDIVLPLHPYVKHAALFGADKANEKQLVKLNLDFGRPDITVRSNVLAALAAEFEQTVQKYQAKTVLEGLPSENVLHVPGRGYPVYGENKEKDEYGDTFALNGVIYQLVKVHRAFEYQPEQLGAPAPFETEGAPIGTRKLTIDGKDVPPNAPAVDLFTILYTPPRGQTAVRIVTSTDTRLLSEITYAIHIRITMEALGDLAVVLDEFASLITAVVQLAFPGAAGPIAAAEIAGTVIRFWGDPEFATIKAVLSGDVGQVFTKGFEKMKTDLSPDKLWDYLLFDVEPDTFTFLRKGFAIAGRVGAMRGRGDDEVKKGSIRRVVNGILGAGGKVVKGAERVHDSTSFAFRKLELGVQASPWAALILRVVARNLHRLEGVSLKEAAIDSAADALRGVQDTLKRFEDVLTGLGSFELPEELVPLEAIIEMVVNFIIDHLPIKYRKPLQGVRGVINATPLRTIYDELFKVVAKELRGVGIDPNIIWREYAKKELDPFVKRAAEGISEEAHALLVRVPFLKELLTVNVPEVATSFVQGEITPELDDPNALPAAPPRLPAGRGTPLGGAEHTAAQRGFGHDFDHVRLHRGAPVDTALRLAGARAATAGSHVYVDSRIDTGSPGGRQVLHHELAHVLQQGGPRPLGARHSSQPATPARSSAPSSWRIDWSAEGQADRLARASVEPAAAPRPVTRAGGIQPSLTDIVERFFTRLGDPTALVKQAERLTEPLTGVGAPEAADLHKAAPNLEQNLHLRLIDQLNATASGKGPIKFNTPFDAAAATIVKFILDNRKEEIKQIPSILTKALKPVNLVEDKGKSTAKTTKVWVLETNRLETLLEEFFFGQTGISVDVELNTKLEAGPDGKQRPAVTIDDPFKTLKVSYVHLPLISPTGGRALIWDHVIDNTFPNPGADRPKYRTKANLVLKALQPSPMIFDKDKKGHLVFGKSTVELIEHYVKPPPRKDLPGDQAPTWADYVKTDPTVPGTYGQLGLRLGFYRDRDNPTLQKGTDRTAHHTVQYLLIEYLVNTKDSHKPFPHALSLYPNVIPQGKQVGEITKTPGALSGIKIAENDKGYRGPNMPTILLSNHAHELGDVHISPKPDDLDTPQPTQGGAVDGIYRRNLGKKYEDLVRDKLTLEAMTAKRAGKALTKAQQDTLPKITSEMLSTAIFNATCKTYTWMRDHMNDKLQRALDQEEAEYYKTLVKSATSPSIYAGGEAQPPYIPGTIGESIIGKVLEKQKAAYEGTTYGFEDMK